MLVSQREAAQIELDLAEVPDPEARAKRFARSVEILVLKRIAQRLNSHECRHMNREQTVRWLMDQCREYPTREALELFR